MTTQQPTQLAKDTLREHVRSEGYDEGLQNLLMNMIDDAPEVTESLVQSLVDAIDTHADSLMVASQLNADQADLLEDIADHITLQRETALAEDLEHIQHILDRAYPDETPAQPNPTTPPPAEEDEIQKLQSYINTLKKQKTAE